MVFIGEHSGNIDIKKRIIMPKKFRERLNTNKIVITRGFENCIFVYPYESWQKIAQKLELLSITKKSNRVLTRFLLASAVEVELDKAGRLLIANHLYEYANLNKTVKIVGVANKIEIWDKDTWDETISDTIANLDQFGDDLEEIEL